MKRESMLLVWVIGFVFPGVGFGYRWPFEASNGAAGPHRVTATFGEYRPPLNDGRFPDHRLHAGVDREGCTWPTRRNFSSLF